MYRKRILLLVIGAAAALFCGCNISTDHVREKAEAGLEDIPVKVSDSLIPKTKETGTDTEDSLDTAKTEEAAESEDTKAGGEIITGEEIEAVVLTVDESKEKTDSSDTAAEEKDASPEAEEEAAGSSAEKPEPDPVGPKEEEESPVCYKDSLGNIRYELSGDVWYEYIYSTADVALGVESLDRALFFLNWDGSYDDYEVYKIECVKKLDNHDKTVYAYHVTYVKKIPMADTLQAALLCEEDLYAASVSDEAMEEETPIYCFTDDTAEESGEEEYPETPKEEAAEPAEEETDVSEEIVNKEGGTFNEYDTEPDPVDGPVRADDDAGLLQEPGT